MVGASKDSVGTEAADVMFDAGRAFDRRADLLRGAIVRGIEGELGAGEEAEPGSVARILSGKFSLAWHSL